MEGEEDYTVEKLWGLGPLKKEPVVENPQDVVNLERYKVIMWIIQQSLINWCDKFFLLQRESINMTNIMGSIL